MTLVARRLSKSLTAVCTVCVLSFAVTSCTTTKKKGPTVMDSRELVPSPYVAPQTSRTVASTPVAVATPRPVIRPKITSTPARTGAVAVAPPRITPLPKPAPAPVVVKEDPVVTPPPVVQPPASIGSKFQPVRIIKKTPTSPPAASSKNIVYVVKKGDNLWEIGRSYGVSVKEICAHANLDASKVLQIGQKIQLPAGARYVPESQRPKIKKTVKATPPKPARASRPVAALIKTTGSSSAGKGKYIVQKGDNLWTIARNHSMKTTELMALNNLKNDRLMPGQVLVVDGNVAKSAPPAAVISTNTNAPKAGTTPDVVIDVNQGVIKGPAVGAGNPPAAAIPAAAASTKNLPHFVVDGDSLANIAEMYGSKVDWIKRENAAVQSDTDLKPGLRINVPVQDIER